MGQSDSGSGSGSAGRTFGNPVPSRGGLQATVTHTTYSHQPFRPLPAPTGAAPYHLSLDDVLAPEQMQEIRASGKLVCHIAGDTGGVKSPQSQQIVAMHMGYDLDVPDVADRPAFFYHLGDVVYYYGETSEIYSQFYEPYSEYAAPIFAIPGNHDGDVQDGATPSLEAFVNTFCAPTPGFRPEAGDNPRSSMTQPNVYWTLDAPFATIIGLYTNVPEGGEVQADQLDWLASELANAPREKAIVLAMHHPVYSADAHHAGSSRMARVLDQAINWAGRAPDAVFSGHVHNYQRFTRELSNREIPYIVAGAGGYWHLHYMANLPDGSKPVPPLAIPNSDATLESFCEDRHGYMKLTITPRSLTGEYYTVARPQESWRQDATLLDTFRLDLNTHRLVS